jgi:hypothetical protein
MSWKLIKPKEKKAIRKSIDEVYQAKGQAAAFDWVNNFNANHIVSIPFEDCDACETDSPAIDHICCICGQATQPKEIIVDVNITGNGTPDEVIDALERLIVTLNAANKTAKQFNVKTGFKVLAEDSTLMSEITEQ